MSVEEKNMNKSLSRLFADLFVQSKGGEELSSKIQRLREGINKAIERENSIFGQFRGLVESFREIIPDEKQRYHAAIKALSTTSNLSLHEIVQAVNKQLDELKILEKSLMTSRPDWREELKAMAATAKQMRNEMSKLREIIVKLEIDEKGIQNGMLTLEKEMELAEKAAEKLFVEIGTEINYIKIKVEEFTAEHAAPQTIPQRDSSGDTFSEETIGGRQKTEIGGPAAPQDTEWQKKCPMCGGQMNFLIMDKMWQCYICAYEESEGGDDRGKGKEKSEHAIAPDSTRISTPILDSSRAPADLWPSSPTDKIQEPKEEPSPSSDQPATKKKTCPACRKKMSWYPKEKAWRCPYCHYERSI